MTPVRLQRKRSPGFDLQAASRAVNGLPALYVGRPTMWGNYAAVRLGLNGLEAVAAFRQWVEEEASEAWRGRARIDLAGHNLACWCRLCPEHEATGLPLGVTCEACQPCHADFLLEIANASP